MTYLPIDLNCLTNHKIIGREEEIKQHMPPSANLSVEGGFLPAESFPPAGSPISFHGIPFVFPDYQPGHYDNLQCEEQAVPIGRSIVEWNLLGFSECGWCRETIGLEDETGRRIESGRAVFFSLHQGQQAWDLTGKEENCRPALRILCDGRDYRTIGISRCLLPAPFYCERLYLPFNPNLHLFAITIGVT